MNTDRHTPGPWRYCPTNAGHMIGGAISGYLAEVRDCGSSDVKANARLIAAAPALLAALRDALACVDGISERDRVRLGLYSMQWYGAARDAIAAVEGR